LLYGSDDKSLTAYNGIVNGGFDRSKASKIKFEISGIQALDKKEKLSTRYAFISRKDRRAGILRTIESGAVYMEKVLKLNSYPSNLSVADINGDDRREMLLSGSSFNGLSIISEKDRSLVEKKIFDKKIFSCAVFVDLNNDGYPDIAAIDLLGSSLKFFYNNSRGEFNEVREIPVSGKVSLLMTYDFNLDGFQDIIIAEDNNLLFIYGDNRASFETTLLLSFDNKIDKVAIGDFNRDGMNDIVYLNRDKSEMSVIFARENNKFFREQLYLSKPGLTDLIPFYSRFIDGLLALNKAGKLYLVSELKVIKDNTSIAIGAKPACLNYFDCRNDMILDICYFDYNKPALNLMICNSSGIPSVFYSIAMIDTCSSMEIDDQQENLKTFYCYSKGKKLIEAFTVNFADKSVKKEKIYSPDPIEDIKILRDENPERAQIYILVNKNGNMRLLVYSYSNFRYNLISSENYASNVISGRLIIENPMAIFYWKKEKHAFIFVKAIIGKDLDVLTQQTKYVIPPAGESQITCYVGDLFNKNRNEAVNFIFSRKENFSVISTPDGSIKMNLKGSLSDLNGLNESQIFCVENKFTGLNKLLIYDKKNSTIERIIESPNERTLYGKKLIESINAGSYFVKSMNFNKNHLVYTDKAENCITIKEITF